MPKAPTKTNLTANSAQILNAIHDSATETYRSMVPRANSEDIASIKEIGNIVMNYTALTNEFLTALYNRIARVIITSKTYYNPWEIFKKGLVEYGESIEEIVIVTTRAGSHRRIPQHAHPFTGIMFRVGLGRMHRRK